MEAFSFIKRESTARKKNTKLKRRKSNEIKKSKIYDD